MDFTAPNNPSSLGSALTVPGTGIGFPAAALTGTPPPPPPPLVFSAAYPLLLHNLPAAPVPAGWPNTSGVQILCG